MRTKLWPQNTKYLLIRVQKGEGCDYMIDCGVAVSPLKSETMEEAIQEAWGSPKIQDYLMGDPPLERAFIVETRVDLPLGGWTDLKKDELRVIEKALAEVTDRELFDSLKRKYGW